MDTVAGHNGSIIIVRVIAARRAQVRVRLGFATIIASVFHIYTGVTAMLIWAALYVTLQLLEYVLFQNVTEDTTPSRALEFLFYGLVLASSIAFTSVGILEASSGNPWGIVCAGVLWSGSLANGTLVSGKSRVVLAVAVAPPLLAFFTAPYFILQHGGTAANSFTFVVAGLINAFGTLAMWSAYQRILKSALEARESHRLALLDPETGLANRAALQKREAELLASETGGIVMVAAISLDRFPHLRGAIGHTAMIDLMRRIAARFARAYPEAQIGRLSSANFGMAFVARDMDHAHQIAATLQAAIATPILLRDNRVDVNVTIGISEPTDAVAYARDFASFDRAMIAVDQAHAARKQIAHFDAELYGNPGSTLSLMSEMLRALDNGQMSVVYQPKYAIVSEEIVGAEALVRWSHPERGALRPDLFVQMAEETGHIAALTEWVLRRAVADQQKLRAEGYEMCISVNWSGQLIDDSDFADVALDITRDCDGMICLEVTETAIIGSARLARQTLERFRAAGLTISIDDYGSGLSSLAYLKNIPADELKIDKAFVMNMATDTVDAVLVRSAVSLAHSLGLSVVAEGVEDAAALELLRGMGCDLAQGYLIARPMPLADLVTFLDKRSMDERSHAVAG
jgi:EAL domain-containing protein (putative c-di-GMP-specific phosphodiesterase class I)/GGDEF domain-containing protein